MSVRGAWLVLLFVAMGACDGAMPEPRADAGDGAEDAAPAPAPPRGVYPLDGLEPSPSEGDLERALPVLDGADVLAFGETVHTSEGYAAARARLIRYLVEKRGVRAIAFESPWGEVERTRAYVERCQGTLADARAGLRFRAWAASRATGDLLAWLCARNRAAPDDKVTVFGFDVQDPVFDGRYVRRFFARAAPAEQARAEPLDACLCARFEDWDTAVGDPVDGPMFRGEVVFPRARQDACQEAAGAVSAYLTEHATALEAASSREEVALARFAVRSLAALSTMYFYFSSDQRRSYEARDEGMAEGFGVLRALRAPGQRVAIVAHNEHIMRRRDQLETNGYDWKSMGSWLGERLGDAYAPVGLFAHRVAYNWDGSKVEELPPRDGEDDLERQLHRLGLPALFLDLRDNALLEVGRRYFMTDVQWGVPADHYRALVFLGDSPAFER